MVFVEVYTGLGIDCPQSSNGYLACSVDAISEIRRRAPCALLQSVFVSPGDSENVWKVIFTTNPSGTVIFQKQVEPGGVSVGKLRLEKSPEVPLITSGEAHAAKKTNNQTNFNSSNSRISYMSPLPDYAGVSWIQFLCHMFQNSKIIWLLMLVLQFLASFSYMMHLVHCKQKEESFFLVTPI